MFGKDDFAKQMQIFLEKNGIDVIYFGTILGIIISLSYWNYFKNWDVIETSRKGIVISTLFGTLILIILSLLKILHVIAW